MSAAKTAMIIKKNFIYLFIEHNALYILLKANFTFEQFGAQLRFNQRRFFIANNMLNSFYSLVKYQDARIPVFAGVRA